MPPHPPSGYSTVAPYLVVDGAAATIAFLRAAFDAVGRRRMAANGDRIAHAEVRIGDTVVMLADPAPPHWPAMPSHAHVFMADVDATYASALAAGPAGRRGRPARQRARSQRADVESQPGRKRLK